jgi:hypothetical protein
VTHDLDSPIDYRLTGARDSEVRVAVHPLYVATPVTPAAPSVAPFCIAATRTYKLVGCTLWRLTTWQRCCAAQYRQCVAARGRLHRVATCSVATAQPAALQRRPLLRRFATGVDHTALRRDGRAARRAHRSAHVRVRAGCVRPNRCSGASHRAAAHRCAALV